MLLDWLTARLPVADIADGARRRLRELTILECHISKESGELIKEQSRWSLVRVGSHTVSFRMDEGYLRMRGSPARCEGNGCNIFGGPISSSLCIRSCLSSMIQFMSNALGIVLPGVDRWDVTRLDIAGNLKFDNKGDALLVLDGFSKASVGKHRITSIYPGAGCYWNGGSNSLSAAAYIKGREIREKWYLYKEKYSENQVDMSDRLLRLELRLQRMFFSRRDWRSLSKLDLTTRFWDFFTGKLGGLEVESDMDVWDRLRKLNTKRQVAAICGAWAQIQQMGYEVAQDRYSRATWWRLMKALKDVGLGDSDLKAGTIDGPWRRVLSYQMANDWSDLVEIA